MCVNVYVDMCVCMGVSICTCLCVSTLRGVSVSKYVCACVYENVEGAQPNLQCHFWEFTTLLFQSLSFDLELTKWARLARQRAQIMQPFLFPRHRDYKYTKPNNSLEIELWSLGLQDKHFTEP